jgi:hypothetical protein
MSKRETKKKSDSQDKTAPQNLQRRNEKTKLPKELIRKMKEGVWIPE